MSTRLLLVRHAAPADTRRAVVGADGPLGERALARAGALAEVLPCARAAWHGPARCARETAEAMGLDAVPDLALRDWDLGSWAGRTIEQLHAERPDAVGRWMADPEWAPSGGETLNQLLARVERWLNAQAIEGTRVAVTHAPVVRAAVVHALGAGAQTFWRVDISPLGVTELRHRDGRWHAVRVNWEPALMHVPRLARRRVPA